MIGRTHILFSLFIFLLIKIFFEPSNQLLLILMLVVGSLISDIDKSSSIIGRHVKFFSLFFKHRGFFHSFYAMMFLSLVVYLLFGFSPSLFFFVGFLSHLLLDSLTKQGVAFFLIDKKIKGCFKSGGLFDKALLLSFLD
ncbi:MAG: metal-dependent hydrolase, partial [Nanoarchaeota archaeon]|nr:metal-dependent hydrolase [Nanoarchaeota archaeon]